MISGGGEAAFLACETCGEKIVGQDDGIVVFHESAPRTKSGDVSVIHRAGCETDRTQALRWQDLELFLRDVLANTQIDLAATERRINEPDGLGDVGLHR